MFVGTIFCGLYALVNLHSPTLAWQDSLMYIYKMYEKRGWPFSVIGLSFSSPIDTFSFSLVLHISKDIILQAIIMTEWTYWNILVCLQKSQFCSDRPVFMIELRFTDSGQGWCLFAGHSCYKVDVWVGGGLEAIQALSYKNRNNFF